MIRNPKGNGVAALLAGSLLRSFDHPVRAHQERLRDGDAHRPGGFQVHHQLELHRLLDRQLARLCAFENLVDVGRGAAVIVLVGGLIRHQSARLHELDPFKDSRDLGAQNAIGNRLG